MEIDDRRGIERKRGEVRRRGREKVGIERRERRGE